MRQTPLRLLDMGQEKDSAFGKPARVSETEPRPRRDKCSNLYSNCERRHENHVLNNRSAFKTAYVRMLKFSNLRFKCFKFRVEIRFSFKEERNIILQFSIFENSSCG